MTEDIAGVPKKSGWAFPPTFWFANGAELCERAAYYGMFITLFRYLNTDIGFTDPETGLITAMFAGGIYLLPTFMGIMADKIGFKQSLMLAFTLLTAGYFLLGAFQLQWTALTSLGLIMCGGAIIKPVISGTAAKCSTDDNRTRAMSIFYMVVNIGSFTGKGLAGELNENLGLQYINFYAAGMSFVALLLVTFFYRNVDTEGVGKTVGEALRGLWTVMQNFRFLSLILIIAGFWLIQGQLYGAMPTYIERMLGKGYKPEWLANINPLTVVILVVPIAHLVRHFKPVNAIGIGMFIIPFTALVISMGPVLENWFGPSIDFGIVHIHPLILLIIIGIALQGLAECFLSPKFLEYASKQAPKGEVGLYLGYQHLTTFFAWFIGFIVAGLLLDAYCPDPRTFDAPSRHEWRLATDEKYRFTLDESLRDQLGDGVPVPTAIDRAFRDNDQSVPSLAILVEGEPKNGWKKDPERRWRIEEPLFTLTANGNGGSGVRVSASGARWSGMGELSGATFEIDVDPRTVLKPGAAVPEAARTDLSKRGYQIPEDVVVQPVGSDEVRTWRIVVPCYSLVESKLETDADARRADRTKARRDLLVYAQTALSRDEMPPLPSQFANAPWIWYVFAGIGFAAFFALLAFKFVTNRLDRNPPPTAATQ